MAHSAAKGGSIPGAATDDSADSLRARRFNLKMPGSTIGFSIPAGVTTETALGEMRRFHLAIAQGRARRTVCIDGPPGRPRYLISASGIERIRAPFPFRAWLRWAYRVALSYGDKWLTMAHRATLGRHIVRAQMAELDAAIARTRTAAEPDSVGIRAADEPQPPNHEEGRT